MTISIISFTRAGYELSKKIKKEIINTYSSYRVKLYVKCEALKKDTLNSDIEIENMDDEAGVDTYKFIYVDENIDEWAKGQFEDGTSIIFIGATGIAVRAIAGALNNKLKDSPVLVIDEKGEYIIPLLSGHMGGANELSKRIGRLIAAVPVITTATDKNNVWAVDLFAKQNKLEILNKAKIKEVTSRILEEKKINILIPKETEKKYQEEHLKIKDKFVISVYETEAFDSIEPLIHKAICEDVDVLITNRYYEINNEIIKAEDELKKLPLILCPKEYIIGIGCRKGKTKEEIEYAINDALKSNNLHLNQIAYIASIDIKKDEQGILDFAQKNKIEFLTFSAKELEEVSGSFEESEFVKEKTGIGNVCERAALKACTYDGALLQKKSKYSGITIAIAKRKWNLDF